MGDFARQLEQHLDEVAFEAGKMAGIVAERRRLYGLLVAAMSSATPGNEVRARPTPRLA